MMSEKRPRTLMRLGAPAGIFCGLLVYVFLETHVLGGYVFLSTVLSAMVLWSLWVTSLSHPGPVQVDLLGMPAKETAGSDTATITMMMSSPPRVTTELLGDDSRRRVSPAYSKAVGPSLAASKKLFCSTCRTPRPLRTHHCRVCNDCIVRYDHHCAWVDNCIGASNTKAFALFLVYGSISILHFMSSVFSFCSRGGVGALLSASPVVGSLQLMLVFGASLACLPCAVVLFSFLLSTWVSIFRNCTTYEAQYDIEEAKGYNRGWLANCKEVLGPQKRLWLIPTLVSSDALHHNTRYHAV